MHIDYDCSLIRLCIHSQCSQEGCDWDFLRRGCHQRDLSGVTVPAKSSGGSQGGVKGMLRSSVLLGRGVVLDGTAGACSPRGTIITLRGGRRGGILRSWHPHFNWVRNSRGTTVLYLKESKGVVSVCHRNYSLSFSLD